MAKKLDAKDIELYLLENTDFFMSRESLVGELSFKHDAKGATSLLEMQVRKLRDEQARLMEMLSGFVSTGKENEELFFKSKSSTLSLIAAKNFDDVKATVESFFKKNFDLLVKVVGRWPVGMDYFRRLCGLFAATFCANLFTNFLKKIFIGSWVLFLCFLLYF